jgi:hypothetical protein
VPLPAGLAYDRAGAIILNPDEEVQARLQLVFAKFKELQSARDVMRFLRASGLPLPVRPLLGPSPHEVVWRDWVVARHGYRTPAQVRARSMPTDQNAMANLTTRADRASCAAASLGATNSPAPCSAARPWAGRGAWQSRIRHSRLHLH